MVTPDGTVKVTDFGIARAADSVPITMTGQVIGTPHYLAPEQARGDQATAGQRRLRAGVVLFECLAGHRPFSADSPVATALAHLREDVPELPAAVPADLVAVVNKAMAKDPAERYADGAEFAAALRGRSEARRAAGPAAGRHPGDDRRRRGAGRGGRRRDPAATVTDHRARGARTAARAGSGSWPALAVLVVVLLLVTRPWEGRRRPRTPPRPTHHALGHAVARPGRRPSEPVGVADPTESRRRRSTSTPTTTSASPSTTPAATCAPRPADHHADRRQPRRPGRGDRRRAEPDRPGRPGLHDHAAGLRTGPDAPTKQRARDTGTAGERRARRGQRRRGRLTRDD